MADIANVNTSSRDVFLSIMSLYFDTTGQDKTWINQLWDVAQTKVDAGMDVTDPFFADILLNDENAPQEYKQRFKIITDLKTRRAKGEDITHIPTVAEYVATENTYRQTFKDYGMNDLATADNFEKLFASNVSPNELNARVSDAFDAFKNADDALKQQIRSAYPGIADKDIVQAMVTGPEGSKQLEQKIKVAGTRAAMATAGYQTQAYTAEQLTNMGFSRSDVSRGLSTIQEQLPSAQRLESLYGGLTPAETQQSLEREVFGGQVSERRKRLAEQEQAAFAGASGLQRSSLSRRTGGQI